MKKSLVEGSSVSSAKSAWGQWASFSLGIGKLQGYSGKAPTLKQPFIAGSKEEADWMSVATKVFEGGVGLLGAYEEEQEKEVDKYLNSHSQEEYIEAIKSKGLPFQNDPIAMKVFKGKYANIYSGMAYSEFKERVLNGDFDGMSEAQMDAELFRHMRDAKERIARDTNGEFSGKAFDEAFYLDSPKQRALMMATLTKRNRDIKVQQDQIANDALIQSSLESGAIYDAESFKIAISGAYNTTGRQYTPKEWISQNTSWLKSVVNSPNAEKILIGLEGKEIPHSGGLKYDPTVIQVLVAQARKIKSERNASEEYAFDSEIEDWVRKGDITAFDLKIKEGLIASGNRKTPHLDKLVEGRNRAVKTLEAKKLKIETESKAQANYNALVPVIDSWIESATTTGVVPQANDKISLGFTTSQLNTRIGQRIREGTLSDEMILKGATNASVGLMGNTNPFRQVIDTFCTSALKGLKGYLNGEVKDPPDLSKMGVEYEKLVKWYEADPNILNVVGAISSNDDVRIVQALLMGARGGSADLRDVLNRMRAVKLLGDKNKVTDLQSKYASLLRDRVNSEISSPLDTYSANLLYSMGCTAVAYGGANANEALTEAKQELLTSHFKLANAYIPKSFFGDLGNATAEFIGERFITTLDSDCPDRGAILYDPNYRRILVFNKKANRILKKYTQQDIQKVLADSFVQERLKVKGETNPR